MLFTSHNTIAYIMSFQILSSSFLRKSGVSWIYEGACDTRPLACKSKYALMFSVMELHPLTIGLPGGKLRPSQWRLLFRIWIPTVFKIIAVTVKVFLTITKMKNWNVSTNKFIFETWKMSKSEMRKLCFSWYFENVKIFVFEKENNTVSLTLSDAGFTET